MKVPRRTVGLIVIGAAAIVTAPAVIRLCAEVLTRQAPLHPAAQEQAPNRREFTIVSKDFRYSLGRLDVTQDDLVKVTIHSEDVAHSFTIDEYRIVKRVSAGGSTTFEFRADRTGAFPFYCNITSDPEHSREKGQLVVRPR